MVVAFTSSVVLVVVVVDQLEVVVDNLLDVVVDFVVFFDVVDITSAAVDFM